MSRVQGSFLLSIPRGFSVVVVLYSSKVWSEDKPGAHHLAENFVACSRLSVSEDDRKIERAKNGISCERDPGVFLYQIPLVARPLFQSSTLTESLEQAKNFAELVSRRVRDLTLFEALTGGAFDRLNWQHSGEFDQNFSKKSNARGFARGGGAWAVWN